MQAFEPLEPLLARLADRESQRSEATVQADVRSLLLAAPFDLDEVHLETPVGDRRRIDIETGATVIEVKRDLRKGRVLEDAVEQLAGYVAAREEEMACRYVGVLTDGVEWRCHHLTEDGLQEVTAFTVRQEAQDLEALLIWLEGVLATAQGIRPTPTEITRRLGAGSSSHALDRASLAALYERHREDPSVRMKRELWARLLTTALGSQFQDDDTLFVEHTLLVATAEIIAHAVLGLPVETLPPASLLSGAQLTERGIYGVVEADFFDWAVLVPGGERFVRSLARRLVRFDWSEVEHDVLKGLYESVIGTETRKKLGEYYTPDWLAERMVAEAVEDPLTEKVLDPACGSGTFLFHAVRRYLAAAEAQEENTKAASVAGVTSHVLGMDLHPVAVTLARVTYVLALGRQRLRASRGKVQIPVYLGDSMQWQQKRRELWTAGHLVDVLVGNPPWLAYRHMTGEMQEKFREMSDARRLWHGAKVATHQDLSGLFVSRVVQLYLRRGGRFAFVMPNAALDRAQFAGFRTGRYPDPESQEPVVVAFDTAWDLRRLRPHFFPRGSAVVFGRRAAEEPRPLPTKAEQWTGRLPPGEPGWSEVRGGLERATRSLEPVDEEVESPYRARFRQGATVVPRVLFLVERLDPGPLGVVAGTAVVRSVRSAYEKPPWKDLDALEGVVETDFLRPLYLGEHVLPYRTLPPAEAILPVEGDEVFDEEGWRMEVYLGLDKWWKKAEKLWLENRSSERLTLTQQVDYHGKLSSQLPTPVRRVVYGKSGMHLCASQLESGEAIIDHTLYWATVQSKQEGQFLCGVLNAAATTQLVRPLMSYGKDERHVDKHVWRLPIPDFDPADDLHRDIAELAGKVEAEVQALELDEERHFVALRRDLRKYLRQSETAGQLEELVVELLNV